MYVSVEEYYDPILIASEIFFLPVLCRWYTEPFSFAACLLMYYSTENSATLILHFTEF